MRIEELIKDLDPVTIIEFKNYVIENLGELCKIKNSNSKIISNHRDHDALFKKCKVKMNKNGKTKNGVQKYICKHCGYTCSETTDTIVSNSHLSYDVWSNIIDNLVFTIVGLGICTTEMLETALSDKVENLDNFNRNSASAYQRFCKNHDIKLNVVPSVKHSNGDINISKINGIHSQLEIWLSKFKGVSIRHLQEYLDWFVFIFAMKRKFNLNKIKTESYNTVVLDNNYVKSSEIFKVPLPINLNVAYFEYMHQS